MNIKAVANNIHKSGLKSFFLVEYDRLLASIGSNDSRALLKRHYRRKYKKILTERKIDGLLDKEWKFEDAVFLDRTPIFVFWYQGFDVAPDIVKMCRNQLGKVIDTDRYEIIELNQSNFRDWISVPGWILDKVNAGEISLIHFSDILRAALLYKWGGYWIDSTYLITKSIPQYIEENGLFTFRFFDEKIGGEKASSPFIFADRHNEIIGRTLLLLQQYWKSNSKIVFFTLFHIFFSLSVEANETSRAMFDKVPIREARNNDEMAKHLTEKFSQLDYQYFLSLSWAHKLTYKFDADKCDDESWYRNLLRIYL